MGHIHGHKVVTRRVFSRRKSDIGPGGTTVEADLHQGILHHTHLCLIQVAIRFADSLHVDSFTNLITIRPPVSGMVEFQHRIHCSTKIQNRRNQLTDSVAAAVCRIIPCRCLHTITHIVRTEVPGIKTFICLGEPHHLAIVERHPHILCSVCRSAHAYCNHLDGVADVLEHCRVGMAILLIFIDFGVSGDGYNTRVDTGYMAVGINGCNGRIAGCVCHRRIICRSTRAHSSSRRIPCDNISNIHDRSKQAIPFEVPIRQQLGNDYPERG